MLVLLAARAGLIVMTAEELALVRSKVRREYLFVFSVTFGQRGRILTGHDRGKIRSGRSKVRREYLFVFPRAFGRHGRILTGQSPSRKS